MTAVFNIARDAIARIFWEAWKTNTPALNGGDVPPVFWPGVIEPSPPPVKEAWARYTIQHFTGTQDTLGGAGSRLFNRTGLVTIQVFIPLKKEGNLALLEQLAMVAKDAFEGNSTSEGVWFRNARIQEVGASGNVYQFNVLAEFTYDELK
jgi:hypothetical protein